MKPLVKQILSAAAGMTVALGLVWGFHTYLQSRNAPTPKPPAPTAPVTPVAATPAPEIPAAVKPAATTPTAPAPAAPVAPAAPTADELVCQAEATRTSDPAAAKALYRKALAAEPDHLFARSGLIHVLTARQDFQGLATLYTALLKDEPTNKKLLYNLAVTQTRLREFLDAEANYRKLLAIEPANRIARENFANVLGVQGKYSGAIVAWEALAKLQAGDEKPPTHPWMQIGRLNLLLKQTDNAKAAFLQVLELESTATTRTAIAVEWRKSGHLGIALAHHQLAFKKENDYDDTTWREQGNTYLLLFGETGDKKHLDTVIHNWRMSRRLKPNQPKLEARIEAANKKLAELIVTEAQAPPANQ